MTHQSSSPALIKNFDPCCYVTTLIYIFTDFPYFTGHLSVSQIYRPSYSETMVENPLLAAYFPAIHRIALPGLFLQQCLCRTPYTGYRMVFHLFFLFTAPKLLLFLCTVIGIPFHKWLRWPRTPLYVPD